ncbi:hypothetical protein AB0K18_02690 [Nonomuraea sp. NPDC049421]|uniref:hypothetical protein n=1 Tax=Nonomuraea sp. NPDC049421 TaxID=3155275 RepID=UPI0034356B21
MVLAAVVLLIAGFVLAKPFLIMWSIVVSVLSALFLVIGAFLRRNELFPGGGQAAAPATPPKGLMPPAQPYTQTGPMAQQPPPQSRPHPQAPQQRTATVPAPAPRRPAAAGIAPDAIVLVIPGRKRYHVPGCRQLAGRDHEELTYEEAREEGFTPCTTCLPDAALGGRQLPPAADPEPAAHPGTAPAKSRSDNSAETRDLRPPVTSPKPDTKASTPSPEPAAAHEEGAAGWFGRPSAAPADQATGSPSAAPETGTDTGGGSDDEPADAETSYFRPPPFARRADSTSGKPGAPTSGPAKGKPGTPAKGTTAAGGSGDPTGASDDETSPSVPTPAKPAQGSASPRPGTDQSRTGAKPGTAGGAASEMTRNAGGSASGKPGTTGESSSGTSGKGSKPGGDQAGSGGGKAGPASGSGEADDDAAGPATAPQPRVTASGMPQRPGAPKPAGGAPKPGAPERPGSSGASERPGSSGVTERPGPSKAQERPGASGASERPSGGGSKPGKRPAGDEPAPGETVILHERPASSAEATAKPRGPLPPGAPSRTSGAKPGAAPGKSGAERPPSGGGSGSKNGTPSTATDDPRSTNGTGTMPPGAAGGTGPQAGKGASGPQGGGGTGSQGVTSGTAPKGQPAPTADGPKGQARPSTDAPKGQTGPSGAAAKGGASQGQGPRAEGSGSSNGGTGSKTTDAGPADSRTTDAEDAGSKAGSSSSKPGDEPAGSKGNGNGKARGPQTVKVITGTRRYHGTACPLVRGAGDGVETMTLAAAEAAGLTSCPVCQHDRQRVS